MAELSKTQSGGPPPLPRRSDPSDQPEQPRPSAFTRLLLASSIAWRTWRSLRLKTRVVTVLVALVIFAILGTQLRGPASQRRGGANWKYSGGETTADEFSGVSHTSSHSARCESVHANSAALGDRENESLAIVLEAVGETGAYPRTEINLYIDGDRFLYPHSIEVRWDDGLPTESFSVRTYPEEEFPDSVHLDGGYGTAERFLDGLRKSKTARIRVKTRTLVSDDIFTFNVAGLIWEHPQWTPAKFKSTTK